MKKTCKIVSFALLLSMILFLSCKGKEGDGEDSENPEKHEKNPVAVVLTPNTAMRVDPLIFTTRISLLKKGEVAEILDRSSGKKNIGSKRDYWYKIRLNNGLIGWVYGSNLKILDDASRGNIDSYLSQFWEEETAELSKALHGKWWSVNRFNDFTNHCLEIYNDGKYKSYYKGSSKKIEGEYNFDFNKNKIIFLGDTSFSGDLSYVRRGDVYTLYNEEEKHEIKFKMINTNPESDDEVIKSQKEDDDSTVKKEDDEG
ncbi:MAG TPA: SH3 domain-containing protein [Spirochaetota bacterium]|nr:SH3 domain-containing protein [Spirochaetota bacterium]